MDKETRDYLNRIEGKVDGLADEMSETKETVAYLRGRMDNGAPLKPKNSNGNTVKYLAETIRVLVVALLTALGIKYLGN